MEDCEERIQAGVTFMEFWRIEELRLVVSCQCNAIEFRVTRWKRWFFFADFEVLFSSELNGTRFLYSYLRILNFYDDWVSYLVDQFSVALLIVVLCFKARFAFS